MGKLMRPITIEHSMQMFAQQPVRPVNPAFRTDPEVNESEIRYEVGTIYWHTPVAFAWAHRSRPGE